MSRSRGRRPPPRALGLALAGLALAAPAARAADTTVAADPAALEVSALGGAVVWVSGSFGSEVLMRQGASGPRRVAGAPRATAYRAPDLGRDRAGRLVLTYLRCLRGRACAAYRDDLRGHHRRITGLAPRRCRLTTAPALWRGRVAYGLACHRRGGAQLDASRTGLYVRSGSGAARRLPLPRDARRFGSLTVASVDLRGTTVAALTEDVYSYAFSETARGGRLRGFLAAASEGDSDEHALGLEVSATGSMWALVDAEHAGDPNEALLFRQAGSCVTEETLANPPGPDQEEGFRAVDLAVDGGRVLLVVPGTGIVSHAFVPEDACR